MTDGLGSVTCPRRVESFPWSRDDLRNRENTHPDHWRPAHGGDGLGATVATCSYCGSMHPDEFMEGLRTRTLAAGPTDKNYKVYVQRPISTEEYDELRARMIPMNVHPGKTGKSIAHAEQLVESLRHQDIAKFYFQHLSREQMIEFVDLYNRRDEEDNRFMMVGYPGHFYRLPFFMIAGTPANNESGR